MLITKISEREEEAEDPKVQNGLCQNVAKLLPLLALGAVLDRQNAMASYTFENAKLICRDCGDELQESLRFTGYAMDVSNTAE